MSYFSSFLSPVVRPLNRLSKIVFFNANKSNGSLLFFGTRKEKERDFFERWTGGRGGVFLWASPYSCREQRWRVWSFIYNKFVKQVKEGERWRQKPKGEQFPDGWEVAERCSGTWREGRNVTDPQRTENTKRVPFGDNEHPTEIRQGFEKRDDYQSNFKSLILKSLNM